MPVEFRPGKYFLPIGTVDIKGNGKIKVKYYDFGPGIAAPHLVKGLFDHLGTSKIPKFAELVGDKSKFDDLTGKCEKYALSLINLLELIVNDVKELKIKLNFHDEIMPGLNRSFIVTIWQDTICNAGGNSWINDSWYKTPKSMPGTNLFKLDCGGYTLGLSQSEKTLETFKSHHKKLRNKCAKHKLAEDISFQDREIGDLVRLIRERLLEFTDMQFLPGTCDLCR